MFREYEQGRTPNPDILCNREIKFDIFLKAAMKINADFVATGHYCQKGELDIDGKPTYQLLAGADKNKDQSYFLCQLNQNQLSKSLFPIGHLQKSDVRAIAKSLGLATADKKDSQGLCFIGKVRLPEFLKQKLKPKKGKVIEIDCDASIFSKQLVAAGIDEIAPSLEDISASYVYNQHDGAVIGEHQGAHYYTIGQRKGLHIGGKENPLFVIATDTVENLIYVGQGDNHPGLYRKGLFVSQEDIHWVRDDLEMKIGENRTYLARIRYRQPLQKVKLFLEADGLYILFDEMQRGITSGQFAAWYDGEELIGSGVIQ